MRLQLQKRHIGCLTEYSVTRDTLRWRSRTRLVYGALTAAVLAVAGAGAAASNGAAELKVVAAGVLVLAGLIAAVAAAAQACSAPESLVLLPGVGVLLITRRGCWGSSSSSWQFLDATDIHSVFIHETLTTTNIHTHLAFLLHNSNKLAIAFPELCPKLDVLWPLYRELQQQLVELLPGLVTAMLGACTLAFDAVYDLLHPLPPEGEALLYEATITHLPREFRRVRKRIVELDIRDEDKMSEELETAGYNFYRRKMREDVCGYSDELTEDVTFRRLMTPDSAARDLHGPTALDTLITSSSSSAAIAQADPVVLQQLAAALTPAGRAAAAAAAAVRVAPPPSRARRATVTTAVSGAGLALGVGVVKLVRLVSSKLQRQRRKAKPRRSAAAAAAGGSQAGSRRQSEQGGAAGARGASRRGSRAGKGGASRHVSSGSEGDGGSDHPGR